MPVSLELSTGFTIEVSPLPPFSLDALREKYKEPEPFARPVKLVSGVMDKVPYVVPEAAPSASEEPEEYELWVKYQAYLRESKERREKYDADSIYFLLAKCVKVVDGPSKVEDAEWQEDLQMAGVDIPIDPKRKYVLWLLQVVIGTPIEQMLIVNEYAVYKDVTYSDVETAIKAMDIKYDGSTDILKVLRAMPDGHWDYQLRLTEMQVCLDSGKSPKEWYMMSVPERAQLIGAYLAPKWMDSVDFEVSRRKSEAKG